MYEGARIGGELPVVLSSGLPNNHSDTCEAWVPGLGLVEIDVNIFSAWCSHSDALLQMYSLFKGNKLVGSLVPLF